MGNRISTESSCCHFYWRK